LTESIEIDARFCGPPGMGNGGYVSGLLAARVGGAAAVRLRAPAPLGCALRVERSGDTVSLSDRGTLIAEARPARVELDVPAPPRFEGAERALQSFRGYEKHPYPRCFGCGPERAPGDGLRVFALPVAGTRASLTAAWTPDAALADETGQVRAEFLWSAMDCPSGFAVVHGEGTAIVTGEMAARVERRPRAGEPCMVIAWPIASEGRKHQAGSAIFSAGGELLAAARTLWIEISTKGKPS
jgi:hypothetical protein